MAYEQLVSVPGSAPNNYVPTADGQGGYSWAPQQGGGGVGGVGIQSVEQTTTSTEDSGINVITVTKTDGTTSTFEVRNGSKGSAGKTAYQYAQDGGYTGTEAEFATKLAEEMPTKLPNPNALTFTGAVEATYDGSNAVSVEIPAGGGSGASYSGFELIVDHTITADEASAASITFTKDTYPLINSQKLLIVEIQKPASVSTPWFAVKAGTVEAITPKEGTWNYYRMVADASNGVWTQAYKSGSNIAVADDLSPGYILSGAASIGNKNKAFADYTSISLVSYKAFLEENTTVKIWGGKV